MKNPCVTLKECMNRDTQDQRSNSGNVLNKSIESFTHTVATKEEDYRAKISADQTKRNENIGEM